MANKSNFRLLQKNDLQGIRELFTQRWSSSQEREYFSTSVIDYLKLTRKDTARGESLVLYGADGSDGKGFQECFLGMLVMMVPGVVVFQGDREGTWSTSGLVLLENGLPRFFSGHENGGVDLVPLHQVTCPPDDMDDRWQALCLWSGHGHGSCGRVYLIRPERWQYITTTLHRWLTP